MEIGTLVFIGLVSAFLTFLYRKKQESERGNNRTQHSEQSIYSYSEPSRSSESGRKPIVVQTPQPQFTSNEGGFAKGLFSFFKFVLLIVSLFAAFGGGFYVGSDIENKRLKYITKEKFDELARDQQQFVEKIQREHQASINQYKEQLRITRELLQQAQMRNRYEDYEGGY
ncbi:MAG: hypothetical protein ACO3AW_09100 [Chitinophagaceae bacterium]